MGYRTPHETHTLCTPHGPNSIARILTLMCSNVDLPAVPPGRRRAHNRTHRSGRWELVHRSRGTAAMAGACEQGQDDAEVQPERPDGGAWKGAVQRRKQDGNAAPERRRSCLSRDLPGYYSSVVTSVPSPSLSTKKRAPTAVAQNPVELASFPGRCCSVTLPLSV